MNDAVYVELWHALNDCTQAVTIQTARSQVSRTLSVLNKTERDFDIS